MNVLGFNKNIAPFDMGRGGGHSKKGGGGKMTSKGSGDEAGGRGKCSENQQQQQHRHDHHDSAHKVPCGLCGKEVALGQRQKDLMATDGKQDLSSTNSH